MHKDTLAQTPRRRRLRMEVLSTDFDEAMRGFVNVWWEENVETGFGSVLTKFDKRHVANLFGAHLAQLSLDILDYGKVEPCTDCCSEVEAGFSKTLSGSRGN